MKPLIIHVTVTIITLFILRLTIGGYYDLSRAARFGMSVMLLFTAMGHFMFPEGMSLMIPEFIPQKEAMVYLTAIIEIMAAIGLQMGQLQKLTAWSLILFFILILPANIKAAIDQVDFQNATHEGPGLV